MNQVNQCLIGVGKFLGGFLTTQRFITFSAIQNSMPENVTLSYFPLGTTILTVLVRFFLLLMMPLGLSDVNNLLLFAQKVVYDGDGGR
jgi:hypothetical protein